MKYIITLTSVIFSFLLNAQEGKSDVKIIYNEIVTSLGNVFDSEYMLLFDDKSSLYERIYDGGSSTKTKESQEGNVRELIIVGGRKKGFKDFFYNHLSTDFYEHANYMERVLPLTKEEGNKIDWKIIEEFKDISGFRCQKATGFFRGRNYTAWFTPEFPVPFGPWKLHGLPGVILEAYDADQMIYLVAKAIFTNSDISLSDKTKGIDLSKAISMQERFKIKEEIDQEDLSKIIAQLPKGAKAVKMDKNCEVCPKPLEIFD